MKFYIKWTFKFSLILRKETFGPISNADKTFYLNKH